MEKKSAVIGYSSPAASDRWITHPMLHTEVASLGLIHIGYPLGWHLSQPQQTPQNSSLSGLQTRSATQKTAHTEFSKPLTFSAKTIPAKYSRWQRFHQVSSTPDMWLYWPHLATLERQLSSMGLLKRVPDDPLCCILQAPCPTLFSPLTSLEWTNSCLRYTNGTRVRRSKV